MTESGAKTGFWRIGFHMCADRPRKRRESLPDVGVFAIATATATATAKLHIGWSEQTL